MWVKGQLDIHVDSSEPFALDVDECVHVKDNRYIEFLSNSFSRLRKSPPDQQTENVTLVENSGESLVHRGESTDEGVDRDVDGEQSCEFPPSESTQKSLHVSGRQRIGAARFMCKYCDKVFDRKLQLIRHLAAVHIVPEKSGHLGHQPVSPKPAKNRNTQFFCSDCGEKFFSYLKLKQHLLRHTGLKYPTPTTAKTLVCAKCKKCFLDQNALAKHEKLHNPVNSRENFHVNLKPYSCDECGKTFSLNKFLTKHKQTHLDARRLTCDLCCQVFSHSYELRLHRMQHNGRTPKECHVCGKFFVSTSDLQQHSLTHLEVKVKLFPCPVDGCGKSFVRSKDFKNHLNKHTGEKMFECSVCQRKFSRSETLDTHMLVHSREKHFMCEFCGVCFTHKSNIKKHVQLGRCQGQLSCRNPTDVEMGWKDDVGGVTVNETAMESQSGEYTVEMDGKNWDTFSDIVSHMYKNDFQVLEVIKNEDGSEDVKILKLDPSNDAEFLNALKDLSSGSMQETSTATLFTSLCSSTSLEPEEQKDVKNVVVEVSESPDKHLSAEPTPFTVSEANSVFNVVPIVKGDDMNVVKIDLEFMDSQTI